MRLIDSHCHIFEADYPLPVAEVMGRAQEAGVDRLLCVGTGVIESQAAVAFAAQHDNCRATIGLHPHDASQGRAALQEIAMLMDHPARTKIAGVGECGLDYFYGHSSKSEQETALRFQIELALQHELPMSFHIRDAFDDFWPIFDEYAGIRGVVHSFTDSQEHLEKLLERGLYVGINGIATFTKNEEQKSMFKRIPLERMLLETDAPFLTPAPKRGSINEPANVLLVAKFLAELRGENLENIAATTTNNATVLFSF